MADAPDRAPIESGQQSRSLGRFLVCARALRPSRPRTAVSILGIALVYFLAVFLSAVFNYANNSFHAYLHRAGNDIWVTPKGTSSVVRSSQSLPFYIEDIIRQIDGVEDVSPVVRAFINLRTVPEVPRAITGPIFVAFGYMGPGGLGGPPVLRVGHPPQAVDEITIDRAAAFRLGVGIGDKVWFADRELRITGITDRTNLIVSQIVFFDLQSAITEDVAPGGASFFIVRVRDGASPATITALIAGALPWVSAFELDEFYRLNQQENSAGYVEIISVIYTLCVVVSFAIVAAILSALVAERQSDVALFFALGAPRGAVGSALCAIGLVLAGAGAVLGLAIGYAAQLLLDAFYPVIPLDLDLGAALRLGLLLMASGLVASFVPIFRLGEIDPFQVFKP
jgi:putative ABC transport system permease protein